MDYLLGLLTGILVGYGIRAAISRRRRLRSRTDSGLLLQTQTYRLEPGRGAREGPSSEQKQEEKADRDERTDAAPPFIPQ